MASSFESPGNEKKQSINGLGRHQPMRETRQVTRSLQQPRKYLTDSLNPSNMSSLSPLKSSTRPAERARARQAFADARKLAAASKTEPHVKDENRPPSLLSSSDRSRLQRSLKHRTSHPHHRADPPSPSKAPSSPTRRQTSNPPRGRRHESIISPAVSEPSPARGYAEAYQRIVDEEDLTQEESVEDLEEDVEHDLGQQGILPGDERSQLRGAQKYSPPMSLRASRSASPREATEEIPPGPEEKGMYKAYAWSSESGAEATEDITETSLDSDLSHHARDLARLSALTEGAKALSEARARPRVGLTVDKLRRRYESNESLYSAFSSRSPSAGSDPWPRTPEACDWKAKPRKDWLNRINSTSGKLTGDVFKRHSSGSEAIVENQNHVLEGPVDEWITSAAEVHLPFEDQESSKPHVSPRGSLPTSIVQQNCLLDQRRQWDVEDDEFTGRSLQVSQSPPLRIGNAPLDHMREREQELDENEDHAEANHDPIQSTHEEQREHITQASRASQNLELPAVTIDCVDQAVEQTPKNSRHQADLKTPFVTGAWVDTPLPTGGRGLPMPTPSDIDGTKEEPSTSKLAASDLIQRLNPITSSARPKLSSQAPLKYSGSALPKSVLEEILKDAKPPGTSEKPPTPLADLPSEDDPTLHLDESTISSLEELIAKDPDVSTLPTSTIPSHVGSSSSPSNDSLPPSRALTRSPHTFPRLSHYTSYAHLISRLTDLAPSLRASGKQIASLERAVSASNSFNTLQDIPKQNNNTHNLSNHDCPKCGCPNQKLDLGFHFLYSQRAGIISLSLPFPRLWHWRKQDWRPRLTWLGFAIILAWALINAESYARYRFCHKLYAYDMIGYGVDFNAPRPPFVLVKVLWRYAVVETSFFAVARAVVRLLWGLVGYVVGFFAGVWSGDAAGVEGGGARAGEQMMGDQYL